LTIEPFRRFHRAFPHLDIEQLIVHYAVFGGAEAYVTFGFDATLEASVRSQILVRHAELKRLMLPPPALETHHRRLLRAVADSDGKTINILRKAAAPRAAGRTGLDALERCGLLEKERSREPEPLLPPGYRLKKEARRYRIQDKYRFAMPFYRFWFTYIDRYEAEIERGRFDAPLQAMAETLERYVSRTFEALALALIRERFQSVDPIEQNGTYWDRHNEFDLLARTRQEKTIVGECKWKGHKICRSMVGKIRSKCLKSGIEPDFIALFSRSGFSNELRDDRDPTLLRFDLADFEKALS